MWSLAYGSGLKNRAVGSGVCICTYPGGTPLVSEHWVLSLSWGAAGDIPGRCGPCRGGRAPIPLLLQHVCGLFAVPFWQGRQPSVWVSRTIAGCLSIVAFTMLCPANTTPHIFSSRTSARGFLHSYCVASIVACENLPLDILAIVKARHMSDCSSCTRPPCLAIVADMLKTYRKLVAASKVIFSYFLNHIRLCSLL